MNTDKIEYPVRLVRFLSRCGVASRRDAGDLVKKGKIRVNGQVMTDLSYQVIRKDQVEYKGEQLVLAEHLYLLLNKPRGFVCTHRDSHAQRTIFDLVDNSQGRLFSVGRLDKDSEGLLLLTSDGDFAEFLTHPRHGIRKTYRVVLDRPLTEAERERICSGIKDARELLKAIQVIPKAGNCCFFIMGEGKKREIRRLVKSVGAKVKRLQRIAIGKLKLGKLPPGKWRPLASREMALAKLNPDL